MADPILRSEVLSVVLTGLVATLVTITVTIEPGEPSLKFTGIDEREVRNITHGWGTALGRARRQIEENRIEVQFSPPVVRDSDKLILALVVALRLALENRSLLDTVLIGDLWPSGALRPVYGAVPALLGARGMARAIVPQENGPETACVPGMEVLVANNLLEVLEFARGEGTLPFAASVNRVCWPRYDMVDVHGLHEGRRAVEIAAAGFHHLIFLGSPGSGKMGLSRRLPSILPELTPEEALEATSMHSAAGFLLEEHLGILTEGPFRLAIRAMNPKRLLGGRYPMRLDAGPTPVRPGEVSLAHHGVLFLDDMQSWTKDTLAAVDAVLAEGQAVLPDGIRFPARPLVVAGALPCPCGFYETKDRMCKCTPERVRKYRARLHGPVFDRAELRVCLSGRVSGPHGENSAQMRDRVVKAREAQRHRFARGEASELVNGRLGGADLERIATLDCKGRRMRNVPPELRAKVLRVARTIADLDGSDAVRVHHVEEAIQLAPRPET